MCHLFNLRDSLSSGFSRLLKIIQNELFLDTACKLYIFLNRSHFLESKGKRPISNARIFIAKCW